MPNIPISLDEDLLKSGRRYAERHQTSMNALIRKLLEQTVRKPLIAASSTAYLSGML